MSLLDSDVDFLRSKAWNFDGFRFSSISVKNRLYFRLDVDPDFRFDQILLKSIAVLVGVEAAR